MMTELELARIACETAIKSGAEQADSAASIVHRIVVDIEKNGIKSTDSIIDSGVSVRSFKAGGMGFSSSQNPGRDGAAEAARMSAEVARHSEPDPDFVSLPEPENIQSRDLELLDPAVESLELSRAVKMASDAVAAALDAAGDVMLQGGLVFSHWSCAVANSLGVAAADSGTHVSAGFFAVIRRGDAVGSDYDGDRARFLADLDPAALARRSALNALEYLDARKTATETLPVVLGPRAAASLIGGLAAACNAESAQRGRSFLAGLKGERVASPVLDLEDDPFVVRGSGSSLFDGEGVPRRPLTIVRRGVLQTYLHNSYTAGKGGEPNTGHGSRGGYSSHVGIGATNIICPMGSRPSAEIISDLDRGILIDVAGFDANPVSGDFSESVDRGFLIENGELTLPVENAMIGGNLLDVLGSVEEFSSDAKRYGAVNWPWIRIGRLTVSGSGG